MQPDAWNCRFLFCPEMCSLFGMRTCDESMCQRGKKKGWHVIVGNLPIARKAQRNQTNRGANSSLESVILMQLFGCSVSYDMKKIIIYIYIYILNKNKPFNWGLAVATDGWQRFSSTAAVMRLQSVRDKWPVDRHARYLCSNILFRCKQQRNRSARLQCTCTWAPTTKWYVGYSY